MIREMNDRFSEANSELLICISCLDPRDKFSKFDVGKLVRLAELYPDDFSRVDRLELEQQLQTFILDVRKNDAFLDINDLGSLAQQMVQLSIHEVFPLVYRLIELALVLPVATASVERVFSAMKKIKTDLRNRMGDEWLNDAMRVYVEKDIFVKIENEPILQRYQAADKTRRIKLIPLPECSSSIRM